MGIQINGQTDIISATDGSLTVSGADLGSASASNLNISGIVTATEFSGNVTGNLVGNVTGNVAGTATTASNLAAGATLTIGAGSTSAPSISPSGDSNTGIFFPSPDTVAIGEGGAEALRVDSSGRLLVGTPTSVQAADVSSKTQIVANGSDNLALHMNLGQFGYGATLLLGRSRNTTYGSFTKVESGDNLGAIRFYGDDGTDYNTVGAEIIATADAATGSNDLPTRLTFSTTAEGASSPTARLYLYSNGYAQLSTTGAQLDILSGAGTGSWGQGIRIGHDATYWTGIRSVGDSNFDRQYLDFWTSKVAPASLTARLTDRFFCNVTTITAFSSERRYKQNIDADPLIPSDCWTVARDLPVRTYEYKDNPGNLTYGPIVDEIETIDASLVLDTGREDEEGPIRTYDNGRLQAMYQVALQEALKRIEQLEVKVASLETK